MNYQEAVSFVEDANQNSGEMGLDAMKGMLEELGHPEKKIKFVHVGGTNGKGSVCTYVSYILASAGYRVGRYISPTIRGYRERIQKVMKNGDEIVEQWILEEEFAKIVDNLKEIYDSRRKRGESLPSVFELETLASFLYFIEQQCDIVVLEVGLGGRLDATNVMEQTECSVFTSISRDHMGFLGDTVEEITREKAGIIKEKGCVVSYDQEFDNKEANAGITQVLKQCAQEKNAELTFADFSKITKEKHSLDGVAFSYKEWEGIKTSLVGENQPKNAALAIEVMERLQKKDWNIKKEQVYEGIAKAKWSGRFQILKRDPFYIVDGAHNVDAARSLKESIKLYLSNKKLLFVIGMLRDKEYREVLELLASEGKDVFTFTPDNERALPAQELAQVAKEYYETVRVGGTMKETLAQIEKNEKAYDGILIFGSLYSLHEVYEYMGEK